MLEKLKVIRKVAELLQTLYARRKKGLNSIFSKFAMLEIAHCHKEMRLSLLYDAGNHFQKTLTEHFLRALDLIPTEEPEFKDELVSLQTIMECLSYLGNLAAAGTFGKDGYEMAVKIQRIVSWMRVAEHALITIKQRPRPC